MEVFTNNEVTMSTINLSQITLDDALNDPDPLSFDVPRRPPLTARITCRVCDKPAEIPILAAGLLCDLCRADLDATEAHIRQTLDAAEQALTDAWTRWDADLAHSGEAEWWARVSAAALAVEQGQMPRADYDRKAQAALTQGGPRAALLRQSQATIDVAAATEWTRGWARAALEEVEAAR